MVEVKETIAEMTAEERLEIAALIAHLNRADSPEYQDEMDRRMSGMDAGNKIPSKDFVRNHEELLKKGR
ncbi:MAG TPA: hypothetical protein VGY56_20060 [Verrucomicrobiae bacterium]|nr:hypothetical protein [Verrucomicrobiae bacterium]